MAKLTSQDTLRVAGLVKLNLTKDEVEKFTPQLGSIVNLIDELNEVDTEDTLPTAQTTDLESILRSDEINETKVLTSDEALSGTENTKNGFIVVPQILHKDD